MNPTAQERVQEMRRHTGYEGQKYQADPATLLDLRGCARVADKAILLFACMPYFVTRESAEGKNKLANADSREALIDLIKSIASNEPGCGMSGMGKIRDWSPLYYAAHFITFEFWKHYNGGQLPGQTAGSLSEYDINGGAMTGILMALISTECPNFSTSGM